MATLALSLAGQFVGGTFGGPIGATIGRALGALAGSAIDNALFADHTQPTGSDVRLQGSSEGGAIPRLYGWGRMSGNIIWATELEQFTPESAGAKATSTSADSEIAASFAVAFSEGEVHRLGRIWADGQLLETEGLTLRFYRGTATQDADSLIEATQGAGNAPAYRGLCYIVFERLPLAAFGNRIPNITVELCRVVGELEPAIRAITVIPGATEFGYDPTPRVRVVGPGQAGNENTHLSAELSDWTLSIDELVALCPNLKEVSIVAAWFGEDLRCGSCTVRPKVEAASREIQGTSWSVAGISRSAAQVISTHDGGPAYGGTPSDAALLAAIADLKARGLRVTLYPMLLMDVAEANTLTDPYTGLAGQPAYPWRGRITCTPAPGEAGTPDQTAAAATQIATFVGTGSGWDYRRFILHYAQLADDAGGVDGLLIGSEMRGLTTVRGAANSFPFVTALATLAADVRAIVGPATAITYAADWSEYSGYQPGGGDRFFHLDPLWAASAIDAIGIDNYMPLTDWRDGDDHADAALFDGPWQLDYISANIAGGEGFDWYYASDADRIAGTRTAITDTAFDEPWVWRFKDLKSWWSNDHHDRFGGVRSASPTAWVPESKRIWFTELGCGAVDNGGNQPNVFVDPKSSESSRPWFSNGAPDPLMQRQLLRSVTSYWALEQDSTNPPSSVYAGRMVDPDHIYLWTWDARPYPAFPNDVATWSDGPNHATGHWLTGRLGGLAVDELTRAIAADHGVVLGDIEATPPLIHGFSVEAVASGRDSLGGALEAAGLSLSDDPDGLAIAKAKPLRALVIGEVVADDGPLTSRRRPDPTEAIGQVALSYPDRERDYLNGTVTAMRLDGGPVAGANSRLVLDLAGARYAAERMLLAGTTSRDTLDLTLPPSLAELEVGDAIIVAGQAEGPFEITDIRDGLTRRISARAIPPVLKAALTSDRPTTGAAAPAVRGAPVIATMHVPPSPDAVTQSRLMLATTALPWPGDVVITEDGSGASVARLTRNGTVGELTAPLAAGSIHIWDEVNTLSVTLYSGHLSSRDDEQVLAGSNRLAVEMDGGGWEIIGFAYATLTAPSTYALTRLLRGQSGTDHAVGTASIGNRVVLLGDGVLTLPASGAWLGQTMALRAYAGPRDAVGVQVDAEIDLAPILPLAPSGLTAIRAVGGNDVALRWMRRSRADTDSWVPDDAPLDYAPEAYQLKIYNGPTLVRTLELLVPNATYTSAQQTTDFGSPPSSFTYTVAQKSALYGPGHTAAGVFNA